MLLFSCLGEFSVKDMLLACHTFELNVFESVILSTPAAMSDIESLSVLYVENFCGMRSLLKHLARTLARSTFCNRFYLHQHLHTAQLFTYIYLIEIKLILRKF
ncbi:MAG: hypothetical protein RM338_26350 [Nostoc sp. DedQUE12a]|nr:hypothetical protein [Nostoc sp. DedQUE12a]